MRFLPLFSSHRRTMASSRSHTSDSSAYTADSFVSSVFSSPCFQPNFCSTPRSPNSSIDSQNIEEDTCALSRQQLAVLRPPHQLFSPSRHRGIPYAINSKDWYHENYDPVDHCGKGFCIVLKRPEDIWDSVYGATAVVYGTAKVFIALCRSFRINVSAMVLRVCDPKLKFFAVIHTHGQHFDMRREGGTRTRKWLSGRFRLRH